MHTSVRGQHNSKAWREEVRSLSGGDSPARSLARVRMPSEARLITLSSAEWQNTLTKMLKTTWLSTITNRFDSRRDIALRGVTIRLLEIVLNGLIFSGVYWEYLPIARKTSFFLQSALVVEWLAKTSMTLSHNRWGIYGSVRLYCVMPSGKRPPHCRSPIDKHIPSLYLTGLCSVFSAAALSVLYFCVVSH